MCVPCNLNSTAINAGLRLCVPNDPSVTNVPGLYLLFDVEVTLVMETFAQYQGTVWPGQLGVDADGQRALLDCNCVPQCQCCCPATEAPRDECGFCTQPPSTPPCRCTALMQALGQCVPCPLTASSQADAVPVCLWLAPSIYQLVDVPRCQVEMFLAIHPGSVFPGFSGLNCFCMQPHTTAPELPPCLRVWSNCSPTVLVASGQLCVPLPNTTLSASITCDGSTSLEAWACPFGCTHPCFPDPDLFAVLQLGTYSSPSLGQQGICGALPGLPSSLVQCVPGECLPPMTLPLTTATGTTAPLTTTAPLSNGCLTVEAGCTGSGTNVAVDGTYCATATVNDTILSFRMICDILGVLHISACTGLGCSLQCQDDRSWAVSLGLQDFQIPDAGACLNTNVDIPGLGTMQAFVTCSPSCFTTSPPTTPPVLVPPPNQVPPVIFRPGGLGAATTTTKSGAATTATTSGADTGTTSTLSGATTTTTLSTSGSGSTAATTATTAFASGSSGGASSVIAGSDTTNSLNLALVVAVPMVFASAFGVGLWASSAKRPPVPKYYAQGDW